MTPTSPSPSGALRRPHHRTRRSYSGHHAAALHKKCLSDGDLSTLFTRSTAESCWTASLTTDEDEDQDQHHLHPSQVDAFVATGYIGEVVDGNNYNCSCTSSLRIQPYRSTTIDGSVADYSSSRVMSMAETVSLDDNNEIYDDLPIRIPSEVVVITDDDFGDGDDHGALSPLQGAALNKTEQKLHMYENLLASYREKIKSSEDLTDTLHEYLRQTQGYAEDLLSQRQELVESIEEMEREDNQRSDLETLCLAVTFCSLVVYLSGGSHEFLVAAVMLHVVVSVINMLL